MTPRSQVPDDEKCEQYYPEPEHRAEGLEPIDEADPARKQSRRLREALLAVRHDIERTLRELDEM